MRRKRKRPRFRVILFLFLLSAIALAYFLSLPIWKIQEVVVNGASMLSENDVRAMAAVPLSENLFYTSLARARANLRKMTAIKEAHFYRIPPATILISIKERVPVAAIVFTGKSAVIDQDGYILNRNANINLSIPNMVNLPVITGLEEKDVEKAERLDPAIMQVVQDVLLKLSPFLEGKRMHLEVGQRDNIILHLDDILLVKIGSASNIQAKMRVFKALLPVVSDKWAQVEYIDVRFPQNPVIRYR